MDDGWMVIDWEKRLLDAFVDLFERVRSEARDQYYETTYWFEDGSHLQVLNFNWEPADEEGEPDTFDYSINLESTRFKAVMLGICSDKWSYQLEKYQNPRDLLRWLGEQHAVERLSGTD